MASGLFLAVGCPSSNPKVLEAHEALRVDAPDPPAQPSPSEAFTEEEKIQRLIQRVRTSGVVFIRSGREQTSFEAAAHLQSVRSKRDGPETASAFIERAANKATVTGSPYQVRLGTEEPTPAHEWLHEQLRQIEDEHSGPNRGLEAPRSDVRAQGPSITSRELTINDVLTIIEGSGAEFLAPQRKKDPKVYSGLAFSKMLRQKWQWLGRGITEIPEFLDDIATDTFGSFEPYRIRFPDGHEQELRPWLEQQIETKRHDRAQTDARSEETNGP